MRQVNTCSPQRNMWRTRVDSAVCACGEQLGVKMTTPQQKPCQLIIRYQFCGSAAVPDLQLEQTLIVDGGQAAVGGPQLNAEVPPAGRDGDQRRVQVF